LRQDAGTQRLNNGTDPGAKDPILCRIMGHSRSSKLAFADGDGIWKSRCRRCGRVMVRIKHKQWVV
jgi:hypothetical protein